MNTGAISNPCGNDNGPAELKEAEKLIAPLFQVFDQTCIEFTDIKAGDVFTVQINHIAVGDAAAFRYLQTDKAAAPLHTVQSDQSVICPIKVPDERIGHV